MTKTPDKTGVIRISITSGGNRIPDTYGIVSIIISRKINKIPTAKIVLNDGNMPTGDFEVSNADDFVPGKEISIKAGYEAGEDPIFKGIVVRNSLKIDEKGNVRLSVECKDKAVKMTKGRKQVNHKETTDSKVISTLIENHSLSSDVDSTDTEFLELVQFDCTDWDFMLTRAEANGLLVVVMDGKIQVKAPDSNSSPVLKVTYGRDLYKFYADMDAASQIDQVTAWAWDPSEKEMIKETGSPATFNRQGNLDAKTLSKVIGLDALELRTSAAVDRKGLKKWADSRLLRAELSRLRGSLTFQGNSKAVPGSFIEVDKLSDRFNGSIFVTGVTHTLSQGDWSTDAEFGMPDTSFSRKSDISSPPAAGLLPAVNGLHIGIVIKLDEDPAKAHRVQVRVPVMGDESRDVWARLVQFHASKEFGAFFLPEIGDEVILGFLNSDPCHPVILGSLYSVKQPPPQPLEAENNIKKIVTRSSLEVEFDEEKKHILLKTPAGNQVILSDDEKSICLSDQSGNKVKLSPDGILLDSPKDITIKAIGDISLNAKKSVDISAAMDTSVSGLNVNAEAQVALTAKGSASAELSAGGQTTVKGAMVMIN